VLNGGDVLSWVVVEYLRVYGVVVFCLRGVLAECCPSEVDLWPCGS
jgi:hypothetical protein